MKTTIKCYKKEKLCLEITVDCNLFELNKMLRERLLIYNTDYERTEVRYLDEYDRIEIDKDIVNLGRWIMNEITEN